jgi:DNA-binding CsgD family transcriptional regulator
MARRTPSRREGQVSELMAAGKSAEQVAAALGIRIATVETHRYKAAKRRGELVRLSRRQRQIVSCVALGLTNDEVAAHLGIARGTVVNHRTLASLAIGVGSVVGLTHYAILHGWVQAGDALSPERIDAALRKIAVDTAL